MDPCLRRDDTQLKFSGRESPFLKGVPEPARVGDYEWLVPSLSRGDYFEFRTLNLEFSYMEFVL